MLFSEKTFLFRVSISRDQLYFCKLRFTPVAQNAKKGENVHDWLCKFETDKDQSNIPAPPDRSTTIQNVRVLLFFEPWFYFFLNFPFQIFAQQQADHSTVWSVFQPQPFATAVSRFVLSFFLSFSLSLSFSQSFVLCLSTSRARSVVILHQVKDSRNLNIMTLWA